MNFFRGWEAYRDGFGKLTGEHWLGESPWRSLRRPALYLDQPDSESRCPQGGGHPVPLALVPLSQLTGAAWKVSGAFGGMRSVSRIQRTRGHRKQVPWRCTLPTGRPGAQVLSWVK